MSTYRTRMTVLFAGFIAGLVSLAGCAAPYTDALVDESGDQIRLTAIERIIDNDDLTDEEKRAALRDLGITDEALIDLFVNEL